MIIKKKALAFICLISVCFTCAYAFDFNQPQSPTLLAANPYGASAGGSSSGDHYRANISLAGSSATVPDRSIYYIDGVFPIYYADNGDTLVFFSPKQKWYEPYALESNMGLGFRKIIDDRYILGMHLFYDNSTSPNKINHQQTGVGGEYLSEPLDVRVNYYHPNDSVETVKTNYEFGSKNLMIAKNQEEAMEGYDIELGGPVLPLNQLNTRTYLGGFFYKSTIANDLTGFRLRTESKINDCLNLDLSFSSGQQDVAFTGGLRAVFPLDLEKIFALQAPTPSEKLPYLKDRMFERVVRDLDIQVAAPDEPVREPVKSLNGVNLGEFIYVNNAASTIEADGTFAHPWTTLSDALGDDRYIGNGGTAQTIYVYKGTGSSEGYTDNYLLDDNTVLWGSGYNGGLAGLPVYGQPLIVNDGSSTIRLGNNDTVQGLNIDGPGNYGIYANNVTGGTIRDNTINGNTGGGIYIVGNSGAISNFNITNNIINDNGGNGIYIYNNGGATMSDFNISGNTVASNDGTGINIDNRSIMSGFNVSGNTISSNTYGGIGVMNFSPSSSMTNFTVSGNTVTSNEGGIWVANRGNLTGFMISGNTVSSNTASGPFSSGVLLYNTGNMGDVTVSDNNITSNEGAGIMLLNISPSSNMNNFTVSGNTVSANEYDGILVYNNDAMSAFNISENTVSSNGERGIDLYTGNSSASMLDFNISGNTISTNDGYGLYLDNHYGAMLAFDILNNNITSNADEGIYIYNGNNVMSDITISDNTIKNNTDHGMYINNNDIMQNITISNNTISSNEGNGIDIYNNDIMQNITISNNTISSNEENGIEIYNDDNINNFNISGNTIAMNGYAGINIYNNAYDSMTNFNIAGNTISHNNWDGIDIMNDYDGLMNNFTISGNTVSSNGENGIRIENYDAYMHNFNITGNTISSNTREGIFIYNFLSRDNENYDANMENFNITGNTISGNGRNGIRIYNYNNNNYGYDANIDSFTISGNTITSNGRNGILLDNYENSGDYTTMSDFNITGNTVSSNGENGICVYNNGGFYSSYWYDGMQDITIEGNTINANAGDGVSVNNYNYLDNFAIVGNTISSNGTTVEGAGINLYNDGYMNDVYIIDNTISANKADGIYVHNDNNLNYDGNGDFIIAGNTISSNGASDEGSGIYILNDSVMYNLGIYGNTIEANNVDGINIYNSDDLQIVNLFGNTVSRNAGAGIDIVSSGSTTGTQVFHNNIIARNGGSGVSLEGTGFSLSLGNGSTDGNNSIYGNGGYDIANNSDIPTLEAMINYWGRTTPEASQFGETNTVTYEPYLSVDPNI